MPTDVNTAHPRKPRRWLAPEVVQTSAMDCGPAALKCLLEGFHIPTSYGRLREACQTRLDGTSIDTIEEIANHLGLAAEQIIVPKEHVVLEEAAALPAIAITASSDGTTHFVVVWRKHGPWLQLMDPRSGRLWQTHARFLSQLYMHTLPIPAQEWRDWAAGDAFIQPLRRRLLCLGITAHHADDLLQQALQDGSWRSLGCMDGAVRMVQSLVTARGITQGSEALALLKGLIQRAQNEGIENVIPNPMRCAQPCPSQTDTLLVSGAILLSVHGHQKKHNRCREAASSNFSPELQQALTEPPPRPLSEFFTILRTDGAFRSTFLVFALLLSASTVVFEALLLRGLFDLTENLSLNHQRISGFAIILGFFTLLLALEIPLQAEILRVGRALELRIRTRFLSKLKRLNLRYFQSRPSSDMSQRNHNVHLLRAVPSALSHTIRTFMTLVLTTIGLIWLDPSAAHIALLAGMAAVITPLCLQPALVEQDLRFRIHAGSLTRFYLDALLGLIPIRAHGAQHSVRTEHEGLLVEWRRTGLGLLHLNMWVTGLEALLGLGLSAWLIVHHLHHSGVQSSFLLLSYWALTLPMLGQNLAQSLRQYPAFRNVLLRLMEPLGAADEASPAATHNSKTTNHSKPAKKLAGTAISMHGVTVHAGGHTILEDINLNIEPGEHIAIVGASGAGKSSLVGLLLGWYKPTQGHIDVDHARLDVNSLRRSSVWIDPAVQIWNDTLLENVIFGTPADQAASPQTVLSQADLYSVLKNLPDGLQTVLGEGGAILSGGEGQRVRIARAMMRKRVRLALLDEPCRGLDHARRQRLIAAARQVWSNASLLCVTHDIQETLAFPRVLVIDGGRIIEDGTPHALAKQPNSHYRTLLEAEKELQHYLWTDAVWQKWQLQQGRGLATQSKQHLDPTRKIISVR